MTIKLAYTPREAAALTPFGYESILEFIKAGRLKAKRAAPADAKPNRDGVVHPGKFVIRHADLIAFLDSLEDA